MKYLAGIVLASTTAVAAAVAGESQSLCSDFKRLLDTPDGFRQSVLFPSSMNGGEEQYYNVDVDADDVSDVIIGGCPASLQSGDPCTLSIELSTGKKQFFTFGEDERFYLARFHSRIYAIVSHNSAGTIRPGAVLRIDRNGISRLCVWP
jgi:hypothetical protein